MDKTHGDKTHGDKAYGGRARDSYGWIDDFSILLTRRAILSIRRDPDLELFTGSKVLAALWLAVIAAIAGSLGGSLLSGALWRSVLYPAAWLVAAVLACIIVRLVTMRLAGPAIAFLAGWCLFWGMLTGVVASWAAQLVSAGWAYGLAGGLGFLIGITHGNLRHADIKQHDGWFMAGTVLAPASICLATWLARADWIGLGGWQQASLTGLVAAVLFLGPVMALYLAWWNNHRALLRLASLYLHHDDFVREAIALLDRAIRRSPKDAALLDRRALAHALNGDMPAAEADWARHRTLSKGSRAPDLSLGWLHLRRDRLDPAAESFGRALGARPTKRWATVGRALVHLRSSGPQQAVNLLDELPDKDRDARNTTYLAQAHLARGDSSQAVQVANDAIDELDSIHGLSWLVRAEAQIGLGNRDHAIVDLNKALAAADEAGIEERAMALLEWIEGDILEEDELADLEQSLDAR